MQPSKDLQAVLKQHLAWHATRLDFAARFILALIHTKTVNLVDISLDLNAEAKPESNYRRIQRFFKDFTIDNLIIARLMLLLLSTREAFVVVMDRTNWRFGKLDITGYLLGETSRQSPKDRKKPGNDDLPREKSRHPPQFGVKGRSVSHADPYPIWTSRASAEMERPWNKKRAPPGEGARVG